MALSPTDIFYPIRALTRSIGNLDRRLRKVETREIPTSTGGGGGPTVVHSHLSSDNGGVIDYLRTQWGTDHLAAVDPHTAYFNQARGDIRYEQLSRKGQPNGYAPLDAGGLIPTVHLPPLAINETFVVASQAEMLALAAQQGDMAIRTDTGRTYVLAADPASVLNNWREVLAAGQVTSVNGYTGVVNLTAADVGALTQAQGDLRYATITHNHDGTYSLIGHNHDGTYATVAHTHPYLPLAGGNLTGPLTIQGNAVDASPDSGNTIVWRTNGFYSAGGGTGGGDLIDPIVRDEIQFAPAPSGAVDTRLWRTSAGGLTIIQPGADGAAANGSQFSMMARSGPGGTTGASSLVWGVDAGIRWLAQMTPNNGPLVFYDYGADGSTFQERMRFEHLGNMLFSGPSGKPVWLQMRYAGGQTSAWIGQAVPGGGATPNRADITAGCYYDGSAWRLENPTIPGSIVTLMPGADVGTSLFGVFDVATDSGAPTTRFSVQRNGISSFYSDGVGAAVDAYNNCRVRPGPSGLAGWWYASADAVDRAFVGLESGSTTLWRIWSVAGGGNAIAIDLPSKRVTTSNDLYVTGNLWISNTITSAPGQPIVVNASNAYFYPVNNTVNLGYPSAGNAWANVYTNGEIRGYGAVFTIASSANIQLSPGGTVVHPSGDNTCILGYPTLRWSNTYTVTLTANNITTPASTQLSITSGFHTVVTAQGGGWIYLRSSGHTFFDGSAGAIVAPEIDNKLILGGTGNRWQYVAAVNGSINTCFEHEKHILGLLDPHHALDALLKTPIALYHPIDSEGDVDESMTYAGIVNTSTDPRLQVGKGALTSAGHQAAYAIAAIKSLSEQLAELRHEVAQLKEALAS